MRCIAFEGTRRIAAGDLKEIALLVKEVVDRGERAPVLIFDQVTSELVELDLRGTVDEVGKRLAAAAEPLEQVEAPRAPGRPKLGVVGREVTLLPRHWEWLNGQPGGASVALRKLVEQARKANGGKDRLRQAQEAAYRFLSAMAGNEPGFEEATRALFAGNEDAFGQWTSCWPPDVREHAKTLAAAAFAAPLTAADRTP